jgi:hypothetical protein
MPQNIIRDKNSYKVLGPIDPHLVDELSQSEKTCFSS